MLGRALPAEANQPAHCMRQLTVRCPAPPPLRPRSVRLSSVLDSGSGGPAALAVLYMELCARLSLPLQPVALEGGRWGRGQRVLQFASPFCGPPRALWGRYVCPHLPLSASSPVGPRCSLQVLCADAGG